MFILLFGMVSDWLWPIPVNFIIFWIIYSVIVGILYSGGLEGVSFIVFMNLMWI